MMRAPVAGGDVVLTDRVLATSQRTVIQAVLNVTPDSFSDGGRFLAGDHPSRAVEAGLALLEEGADIIDVGGESSRPGADPVDVNEELRRVVPVVEALAGAGATISVDTVKAAVAREAVGAGAVIVNDISAGSIDEQLLPTVAELDVGYIVMHMQGTPRTMQRDPTYGDVVAEVTGFLRGQLQRLATFGIAAERVIVDPGLGFGKTAQHNLALLARLDEVAALGRPVLIGASRKSFLGQVTGQEIAAQRLEASLAAATIAVLNGARVVRVHDVAATRHAVAVADAVVAQQSGHHR